MKNTFALALTAAIAFASGDYALCRLHMPDQKSVHGLISV